MSSNLLTEREITALADALFRAGPATEDQLDRLLKWATLTKVNADLLRLALAGRVRPIPTKGDFEWIETN